MYFVHYYNTNTLFSFTSYTVLTFSPIFSFSLALIIAQSIIRHFYYASVPIHIPTQLNSTTLNRASMRWLPKRSWRGALRSRGPPRPSLLPLSLLPLTLTLILTLTLTYHRKAVLYSTNIQKTNVILRVEVLLLFKQLFIYQ